MLALRTGFAEIMGSENTTSLNDGLYAGQAAAYFVIRTTKPQSALNVNWLLRTRSPNPRRPLATPSEASAGSRHVASIFSYSPGVGFWGLAGFGMLPGSTLIFAR